MTVNYREAYGLNAWNGILFNHESPLRGKDFVTQKIATAVAEIVLKKRLYVELGNLDAQRDWGHAKDYVYGMWLMLQKQWPGDYVLATGQMHSVKEFCALAFNHVGLDWAEYVRVNKKFIRPAEVPALCGDPSQMEAVGWKREHDLKQIAEEMVDAAIERLK